MCGLLVAWLCGGRSCLVVVRDRAIVVFDVDCLEVSTPT